MKNIADISKYVLTYLTLATLATRVVSVTEDQSQNLTNVICEQIRVANSSYEGHKESMKLAYPEGCPNFTLTIALFKRKCPFTGAGLTEEMKYQQFNRSLYSFTSTFSSLRNAGNPMSRRLANEKERSVRNDILDTAIKHLQSLQTEVKEISNTWGPKVSKSSTPCYELEDPSRLHAHDVGQMCTIELELFKAYHTLLRRAYKAFCHKNGMKTRNGPGGKGRKVASNNKCLNGKRVVGRKNNGKSTGKEGKTLEDRLKGKGVKCTNRDSTGRNIKRRRPPGGEVKERDPQRRRKLQSRRPLRSKKQQINKKRRRKETHIGRRIAQLS